MVKENTLEFSGEVVELLKMPCSELNFLMVIQLFAIVQGKSEKIGLEFLQGDTVKVKCKSL